ncbi:MAG: hypothetical protein H2184_04250 [Candidatus Galacturonibacter soehngenii]|nr:hypothetical protein [Candidatus Galacturonibacter soehngenii]
MKNVDKTIDKLCEKIQEKLENGTTVNVSEMVTALAELITARASIKNYFSSDKESQTDL